MDKYDLLANDRYLKKQLSEVPNIQENLKNAETILKVFEQVVKYEWKMWLGLKYSVTLHQTHNRAQSVSLLYVQIYIGPHSNKYLLKAYKYLKQT